MVKYSSLIRAHERWNIIPFGQMYGIFPYIYHKNQPDVGKYSIWPDKSLSNPLRHPGAEGLVEEPREPIVDEKPPEEEAMGSSTMGSFTRWSFFCVHVIPVHVDDDIAIYTGYTCVWHVLIFRLIYIYMEILIVLHLKKPEVWYCWSRVGLSIIPWRNGSWSFWIRSTGQPLPWEI